MPNADECGDNHSRRDYFLKQASARAPGGQAQTSLIYAAGLFAIAAAIDATWRPTTILDTGPGSYRSPTTALDPLTDDGATRCQGSIRRGLRQCNNPALTGRIFCGKHREWTT